MIPLERLSGPGPHRVHISLSPGANVLGGVQDENLVLRCFCRKGWAVQVDGVWKESTKAGKVKA